MQRVWKRVERVAAVSTTVLLTGETGTGKSAIARAIHDASPRRNEPFVHVDCGAFVGGLLEAELYGVARGAYTGAQEARAGRFEVAGAGTLFLDEIGELPNSGQLKLLRLLEEGTYERIGETTSRAFRARVIAATHVDLESAIRSGRFRTDLYYRLHVLGIEVPPLRERPEEIRDWIERAANRAGERLGSAPPRFAPESVDRMCEHEWPGNLRELFHVVEAAAVLEESPRIEASLIEELLGRAPVVTRLRATSPSVEEVELDRANGNLSLAARRLGIPRSTLRYRLGVDDSISRGKRLRTIRSKRDGSRPG